MRASRNGGGKRRRKDVEKERKVRGSNLRGRNLMFFFRILKTDPKGKTNLKENVTYFKENNIPPLCLKYFV